MRSVEIFIDRLTTCCVMRRERELSDSFYRDLFSISVCKMFSYILSLEICLFVLIIADPNLSPVQSDSQQQSHSSPSPYNYYGYRQTPSPYQRNSHSDTYSSGSPYSNTPRRSTANQCKLHINCPSKRTNKTCNSFL